jgi:hypothetical protein
MPSPEVLNQIALTGDTCKLTPKQKTQYMNYMCDRFGLNPSSLPFAFITVQGKEILYAKKDATEQLRRINKVSLSPAKITIDRESGIVMATVEAEMDGRRDAGTGAASIVKRLKEGEGKDAKYTDKPMTGDDFANAVLKAETKAKRRATLSIVGLGFLDESEIETVKGIRGEEPISQEQMDKILTLCPTNQQVAANVKRYGVERLVDLKSSQAEDIIKFLEASKAID